jgi:hypothetical protein
MDGDYAGLPLNDTGRWRAQSWVPENFEVPELVCRPHVFDFSLEGGVARLRWAPQIHDPTQTLIAFHGRVSMREQETTIWMDGRPCPPDYVRQGWSRFSTGEWEGDTLVQTATHLIEAYIRRWGPMRSDQATVRTAAGQKLPPRSGPQDDGRGRNAVRAEAGRPGNHVSRVHREDEKLSTS